MDNRQLLLRGLPKIDELLLDEQLVFFMESTPRSVVVDAAREIIDELRREILSGEREDTPEKDELIAEICDRITGKKKRNLRTLINATGVVLHTNLGRSNPVSYTHLKRYHHKGRAGRPRKEALRNQRYISV